MTNDYFKNYDEFKNLFQIQHDGKYIRKNKVFLSALKHATKVQNREFFDRVIFPTSTNVITYIHGIINTYNDGDISQQLCGYTIPAKIIQLDEFSGICKDGDVTCVRYVKIDKDGKESTVKLKAGKVMRRICDAADVAAKVGQAAADYFCECFANDWIATCKENGIDCSLKVDDDFEFIYSSENYFGTDFGSCMTDDGYHTFYNHVEGCSAASLLTKDGYILARCIIYTAYRDDDGSTLRLAERQYSSAGKQGYKQVLVNKLIAANMIDAYKPFRAGCGDSTNFVLVDGTPINDVNMYINVDIDECSYVSYQDSFKWLDRDTKRAYNHYMNGSIALDVTNGEIEDNRNYDEYNDVYTNDDLVNVFVWNRRREYYDEQVTSEDYALNNMSTYDGEFYDELYYSDIIGEEIPLNMIDELEDAYKQENWNWDEYMEEYIEDDVTEVHVWSYINNEYYTQYTATWRAENEFHQIDGEYYDVINNETELPLDA